MYRKRLKWSKNFEVKFGFTDLEFNSYRKSLIFVRKGLSHKKFWEDVLSGAQWPRLCALLALFVILSSSYQPSPPLKLLKNTSLWKHSFVFSLVRAHCSFPQSSSQICLNVNVLVNKCESKTSSLGQNTQIPFLKVLSFKGQTPLSLSTRTIKDVSLLSLF